MAVPKSQRIGLFCRAEDVLMEQWSHLSAGSGSQGERVFDWGWLRLDFRTLPAGWKQWLLVRRTCSDEREERYFLVYGPERSSLEEVVKAAGKRWRIEEAFEQAKQEVGLDEYEVRTYPAWNAHITLSMLALAFLRVLRT